MDCTLPPPLGKQPAHVGVFDRASPYPETPEAVQGKIYKPSPRVKTDF